MAELTHKERLQPSLLDRLTDEAPDAKQESRMKRVLSLKQLKESVKRDLIWLFNTTNMASASGDLVSHPFAAKSVLNYGLPDFAGRPASNIDVAVFERQLRAAIWDFEPRLVRESVRVAVSVAPEQTNHNAMAFTIDAELWAEPVPLRLFLRTEIDLETGKADVQEILRPGG